MYNKRLTSTLVGAVGLPALISGFAGGAAAQTTTLISATVNDGSFETPTVANLAYAPVGTPWTFTSNSGISRNSSDGSTFGVTGSPADGSQYGFIQLGGTHTSVSLSQTFNLSAISSLSVSFAFAGRQYPPPNLNNFEGNTVFAVLLDGTTFDTETTATNQPFAARAFNLANVAAGSHTLTFTASEIGGSTGDNTALLDNVRVTATATAPEPSGILLLGFVGLLVAPFVKFRTTS